MKITNKTKEQLFGEIKNLNSRIAILIKSELQKKKLDEQLAAIYQNAPFIMMLVDSERRVLKINEATLEFADSLEKELIGKRGGEALRCLHHLDNPKGCGFSPYCKICKVRTTVLDTFKTGKNYHNIEETLPFSINGVKQELTLIISTVMLKFSDETLTLVTIQDITERKLAEKKLHQYANIVSSSTDMLALLDKQYRYIASNMAYLTAFKLTSEQLIGRTMTQIFGEEIFNNTIKPNADKCMNGEEVCFQDWFDFPAYKKKRFMDINYYPYYSIDKKVVGFVVSGRNNTERKQAEENLINRNKELESWAEVTTDRELFMLDLKKEINELLEKSGKKPKFQIPT